ncbi:membrane-associated protein, putative [Bodo saltans]|uniref:Membrane-associated protein, putative n=1 Tax=Bodo saltans TaxID=75058 RepID=A0A0S4J8R7_BODSA|nr:membrane-associated protein, putative [Bodo saltans]|eukprot:CUG87789.1 membrane-associated protein, putative [Bodo saltans]
MPPVAFLLFLFLSSSHLSQGEEDVSSCVNDVLLFSVSSMTYSDAINVVASMDDVCPPVIVTAAPNNTSSPNNNNTNVNNTTDATSASSANNNTGSEEAGSGGDGSTTCIHYDACVVKWSSVPSLATTGAEGSAVYVPPVMIAGALSPYLEMRYLSSIMALFSTMWGVETVVDDDDGSGGIGAYGYQCTVDVVWAWWDNGQQTTIALGQQFVIVLNAPKWSASLRNDSTLVNGTVDGFQRKFMRDQPREVLRASSSVFDSQSCVLSFASHLSTNASAIFQTLFGPPNVTSNAATGSLAAPSLLLAAAAPPSPTYRWSPGGVSTVQVSFDASVERVLPIELEDGLVIALVAVNVLLLPVVPVLGGMSVSSVLLFASPYCVASSTVVLSLERGRYRPITELFGATRISLGDDPKPLLLDSVVCGLVYFCILVGLLAFRGIGTLTLHRVAPPTQSFDICSRLLLTIASLAPLVAVVFLGALLGPSTELLAPTPVNSTSTTTSSWASDGAWSWVYVLVALVILLGVIQMLLVFAHLATRTHRLYDGIDDDVGAAVSSARFVRSDAPRGIIALVLAVVELEGLVQPSMVYLRPFASVLAPFRKSWAEWMLLSGLIPWIHAFHLAVPTLSCGVTEMVVAVCWSLSLVTFAITRPLWNSVESILFVIFALLMVASCSMMAVYHRQDDDLLSHELLEAGQIATATTACVLLVWCVFSGLSDVRFWLNRTLAIRSIWGNDEDLWWRNCIRVPVSSMLQQNVTDDEDDDDLKDEADGPITKAVKGEEHDVQARSLRFPSALSAGVCPL